jgi:hypothetical protein
MMYTRDATTGGSGSDGAARGAPSMLSLSGR